MLLAKRIMKDYLAFYAICVYDLEVLAICQLSFIPVNASW